MVFSSCFHFLLLLSLAFPLFLNLSSIFAYGDEALVDKICKETPYPKLCASTVRTGPSSKRDDAKGIASIIVKAAKDRTYNTLRYLKKQPADQDPSFDLVVEVCREQVYPKSHEALVKAAKIDSNASKAVGDAASALAACRKTFEVESGPRELPKMQESIEQLLAIALKVFSFL